jgi:hypothetical protein
MAASLASAMTEAPTPGEALATAGSKPLAKLGTIKIRAIHDVSGT